ncbi:MAG: Protein TolB [Alphaproteobacteria bacterium MarineAlpha6_Bin2]|nr:MAG: Protein TolB [Alphaproteobacteria bacterium MarineAlpha6_Bin2]
MFYKLKRILIIFVFLSFVSQTKAELKIDITSGYSEPTPIGISEFISTSPEEKMVSKQVSNLIKDDLERSGLFRVIDPKAYIQKISTINIQPRFSDWKIINAQALIVGQSNIQSNGDIRIEFRLWDVFAEQQMAGWAFNTTRSNWRQISHRIADKIYERLTGEIGYFDTRIAYVAESGPPKQRIKRLAIMDQDGANHRFLTNGKNLVLTPRFSPSQQELTYLSFINRIPRVYLLDIETGRQEIVGDFPGMTFAPRFSPLGDEVIMTLADKGNSDIYTLNLKTNISKQLTKYPGIDTSPSYSPNSKQIVFNSDRGGSPQLYVMSSNGKNIKRISFGKGNYSTPVWSPRGDYIAFTKFHKGTFYVGVMTAKGKGERVIAKGFLVEGPTWTPNGRMIAYTKKDYPKEKKEGKTKIYLIDLTGFNDRQINTPLEASDPAWSPLLQ